MKIDELLDYAVKIQISSGIAAAWGSLDDLTQGKFQSVFAGTESHYSEEKITANTIFDLASLTKILATTSLFMRLHERGLVDLDAKYPGKPFTFHQLLTHSSGLPAWKPFYEEMIAKFGGADELSKLTIGERKNYLYELVNAVPLENQPGEKIVYSDLGFLLLSEFVENLENGKYFCDWVKEEVWSRIKGCGLQYRPLSTRDSKTGIAATEFCPWRGMLQGEVHDDNCWSMGGVAGHAGVFGSLNDVVAWTRALTQGKIVSFATLEKFSKITSDSTGARRAIGFDVPALDGSGSTANVFSPNGTIGHLGFTGTSVWIDLDAGRFAILLTNRVHPSRDDNRIRSLRPMFHRVAF
jgi:CubicO group peptidase (beta-lactamase class C family)